MIFFYIDESGNTGPNLDSTDQPVHWVVGVAIPEQSFKDFEADMLALALKTFRGRAAQPDFEFHGSDIFQGRGDCSALAPGERVELYREITSLIGKHDCSIFSVGINKEAHKQRALRNGYPPKHPHALGTMFLVERIDAWLEELQPTIDFFGDPEGPPIYGLLVADEQKEMDRTIVERFAFWRRSGTEFTSGREVRYLIDTVHYVPSEDSWGIQLADCVAYLLNRREKLRREKGTDVARYTQSDQAVLRLWRDNCAAHLAAQYTWP